MSLVHRITLVLLLFIAIPAHAQSPNIREIWIGTFEQSGLLSWKGKMELYLTYQASGGEKTPVKGVITWHGKQAIRAEIVGEKDYQSITFTETKCLQENCRPFLLGGSYSGTFDERYLVLRGKAGLSSKELNGTFLLKRVVEDEEEQ